MRWTPGEAEIDALLTSGALDRMSGAAADGAPWMEKARQKCATARSVAGNDPESAIVLAYDAARFVCTALLAQQGLRPTSGGGHYAVERAVRAQFGDSFRPFGALRRRRNELEYPLFAGALVDADEAASAVTTAEALADAASRLLPDVGLF